MSKAIHLAGLIIVISLLILPTAGQSKEKSRSDQKVKMWRPVNVGSQDLFYGPGGRAMLPDLKKIEFIKSESGGTSKKYRIKDGSGRVWVAKIDKESQPETVAVRLLAALGYETEINYLVPKITIPGKGTFENVRLEARPQKVDRKGRWKWKDNPFTDTDELQGKKIMMALMNNWDLKDGNTIILQQGNELLYVISDLGATFGTTGNNSIPIFWRIGRSINKPEEFSRSKFIDGVSNDRIEFAFKGKDKSLFDDITVQNGRWLMTHLSKLSDKQISDAFRAANYSPSDIKLLTLAVKNRIQELGRATSSSRLASTR